MTLIELIGSMTPDERRGALLALDHCSKPLTPREIERLIRSCGFSRSASAGLAGALKYVSIIAVRKDA